MKNKDVNYQEQPELDLREIGKGATAYPELTYNRLPSSAPIEQPDSSLFAAVFFRDNTIGSFLARPEATAFDPNKNMGLDYVRFVPRRHMEQHDAYALVTNDDEAFSVMRSVDAENERTRMVAENPWKSFFYNFGNQAIDPVNAFPGSILFRNVTRMSNTAKAALQAGAAGVISSTAQEAFIQGNQLTRTAEESIMNPIVAGIFSSVIGGAASEFGPQLSKMSKGAKQRAKRELLNVLTDKDTPLTPYGPGGGAMMARVNDNTLAKMPKFVQKAMVTSLMNDMLTSDFQAPKDVAAQLFQNNYTFIKNESGIPSINAESQIKLDISKSMRTLIDVQNAFFEQAGVKRGLMKADPTGQILNYDRFESAVAHTLFSGETHDNAGVNKAAKLIRDNIFDPRKDAAIELGLLPEGVTPKNAFDYFSVHWNQQKIKEDPNGFMSMATGWFKQVNDVVKGIHENAEYKALAEEIRAAKKEKAQKKQVKQLEEKLSKLAREIALRSLPEDGVESIFHTTGAKKGRLRKPLKKWELEIQAQQTRDRIIGNDNSRLKSHIVNQLNRRGRPLTDRSFLIPQRLAFEWQNQNASDVARSYIHAMDPVIRMTQMARDLEYKSIADWHDGAIEKLRKEMHEKTKTESVEALKARQEEYKADLEAKKYQTEDQKIRLEKEIAQLEKQIKEKPKEGKKLSDTDKAFKKQSQNITKAFELLLGIYGDGPNILDNSAAKYYKAFLNWNYIRLLGFMTLSSIPDMGLHVLTHGPFASIYHGLRPVLKSAFGFAKNMSKDDLNAIGYACNTVMGTRLKSMSGHEGLSTQPSFFGRTADKMVESFGNVTLMNQWNDTQQVIAGTLSINRILKAVEAHANGTLSKAEQTRLARLGIDVSEYGIIHEKWKAYGGEDGGTYFADWNNWEIKNKEEAKALQSFQRAVANEIDSTVIVPGLGDKPLIAQTNFGKLLLQFKSFAFAATNKILFAGIQRRHDANTYFGMATMLALGSLSYLVSQAVRGNKDIDLSFKKLAHEAIDRSGLLGILAEVYNMAEKAGLGFGTQASRYQSRSLWGALLGPSTGAVDEMLGLINAMRKADGEHPLTTKDFEKLLRLAPYQNLFYTYFLSRKVSGALAPKLGFEEAQDKRVREMFK